jgi:hypothetical protein
MNSLPTIPLFPPGRLVATRSPRLAGADQQVPRGTSCRDICVVTDSYVESI